MSDNKKCSGWRLVLIIFGALALLVGASYLPLSKLTNGYLSDINILSDVVKLAQSEEVEESETPGIVIDPCLAQAIEEDKRGIDTTIVLEDSTQVVIAVQPNKEGEQVIIEDYTESGKGLERLQSALASGRLARIAVVGDSYIEGDIFTQDLREMLQQEYGGNGVGYMNLFSEFPGFRRSIRQSGGNGWTEYAASKKHNGAYMGLSQHYYKPSSSTTSTYKGASKFAHSERWNRSQFLFVSPNNSVIKVRTDSVWMVHEIVGSPNVQAITVDGSTSKFDVSTSNQSVVALGVWLTDTVGVNVDCMSSRGFSGVTLRNVNTDLVADMAKFVDYDLIILEFGINAMSAKQTDYSTYGKTMVKVVEHVRQCYPNADILMMGIGDRGSKRGSDVHSMKAAPFMVDAQRESARRAHCLFWDTREAMGGEDAIVQWVRDGFANKDYVHLNHKGGQRLAESLFNAIKLNLNK